MDREPRIGQYQTDQWFIERVLAGDSMAFEGLMRRYNQSLYRICRGVLGNHSAAEEAVQNAYMKAFRNLKQFRGVAGIGPWICRIARNEALGLVRKENQRLKLLSAVRAEGQDRYERHSPESDLASVELSKAIDALPPGYRVAFVLREIEGLSLSETADLLNIQSGTVKSRVFRARKLLRDRLGPDFDREPSKAMSFAGKNCDRIVGVVLAKIAGTTP